MLYRDVKHDGVVRRLDWVASGCFAVSRTAFDSSDSSTSLISKHIDDTSSKLKRGASNVIWFVLKRRKRSLIKLHAIALPATPPPNYYGRPAPLSFPSVKTQVRVVCKGVSIE